MSYTQDDNYNEHMTNIIFYCKALVFGKEGKCLVLRRAKDQKWDLPGGAVHIPETHEDALRREVREETGIETKNLTLLTCRTSHEADDSYVIFLGYRADACSTDAQLSREHTDFQWLTETEFRQCDLAPHLKDLMNEL